MAYADLAVRATGDVAPASDWIQERDNWLVAKLHKHGGSAGDGDDELAGVDSVNMDDISVPAAPGANKTIVYAVAGALHQRAGAAGADQQLSEEGHVHVEATKAQMEAETAGAFAYVPPNLVKNSPGVAKVWALIAAAGMLTAGYNVASITDVGTGNRTVVIATDFSSANYAIVSHLNGSVSENNFTEDTARAAGSWTHTTASSTGTPADIESSVVAFGDQ